MKINTLFGLLLIGLAAVSCKGNVDPGGDTPTPVTPATKTYFNPVLNKNVADPTIYDGGDGYYYLFYTCDVTSQSLVLYRSKNLVDWESTGKNPFDTGTVSDLMQVATAHGCTNYYYWAPTVRKINGKFVMYTSAQAKCMVALVSDKPEGPFHFPGTPKALVDKTVLPSSDNFEDSCVTQELDGTWYLMFGSCGNMNRTKLSNDGLSLAEGAVFDHVAGNVDRMYDLYEGLYAYRHGNYWYLFAARGQYSKEDRPYKVVVGRCETLGGVFLDKDGKRMDDGYASLILEPNSLVTYLGGAHTGEIFTDKEGRDYIFYQRYSVSKKIRPLFLQQIFWGEDGWPYFKDGVTQMSGEMPAMGE